MLTGRVTDEIEKEKQVEEAGGDSE